MSVLSFSYIALGIVVLVSIRILHTAFRKGLRELPGPFVCRFTRLWKLREALSGTLHESAIELHNKYGPIVRVGPNHVWVDDPDEIQTIYGIHSDFQKTNFYNLFSADWEGKPLKDLFTTLSPTEHKLQKRNVSNAYAMSSMLAFEPMVNECIGILIDHLDRLRTTTSAIDMGKWMQWYAFDVIGSITFSGRFGFMEQEKDIKSMISQIEKGLAYGAVVGQLPEMHGVLLGNSYVKKLLGSFEAGRNSNPLFQIIPFTIESIAVHSQKPRSDEKGPIDFLSRLRQQQKINPSLTDFDILTHCVINLLAGSDTTGITLRAILYMLVKNPRCYALAQAEIDELDKRGALDSVVTFAQSLEMPYLQAAMKEGMRLHPAVGFPLERYVPPEGASICGHFIPGGTVISMNAWCVHRNKAVFGEDAEQFRPERWLDADEEKLKRMGRASLTFGAGTRTCIGKNISLLEISKVVPQLLRTFTIEMDPPASEWKLNNYWFVRQSNFVCKLTPRKKDFLDQKS